MRLDALIYSYKGVETKRYHTWPTLQEQNVAAHSHGVAMICAYLAGAEPPGIGTALLMAALTHDLAEWEMGDLPAPVKRAMPGVMRDGRAPETFREMWNSMEQEKLDAHDLSWEFLLTPDEKRWLKMADAVDGCFRCIRERAMGNQLIKPVWRNFISYVEQELNIDKKHEKALYAHLLEQWSKYDGTVHTRNRPQAL